MIGKICLIPDKKTVYDAKMLRDFALGLNSIGIDAVSVNRPIEEADLNDFVQEYGFDSILRVNKFPPLVDKRVNNFRHISWFQDVFVSTKCVECEFNAGDFAITLGHKDVLGLDVKDKFYAGAFNLYVNPNDFDKYKQPHREPELDFNFIAYIPFIPFSQIFEERQITKRTNNIARNRLILYYFHKFKFLIKKGGQKSFDPIKILKVLVRLFLYNSTKEQKIAFFTEQNYQPLTGSLDIHQLKSIIDSEFSELKEEKRVFIDFCTRELPRFLDRYCLISEIMNVSQNIQLFGDNWGHYEKFRPYHRGVISTTEANGVFHNSKITLQNNNHGIGLHSRTLSAMASGGFVFTHKSKRDEIAGGIKTEFEPGQHYGEFTLTNIQTEAERWLKSESLRKSIVINARNRVINDFTY